MSSVLALQRSRLYCQPVKSLKRVGKKNNANSGVFIQTYQVMRSVQQDIVCIIQFCTHNHMIATGHSWNCGRTPHLVHEMPRRMVLAFVPGMQEMLHIWTLTKFTPALFTRHIYIILLCIIQR